MERRGYVLEESRRAQTWWHCGYLGTSLRVLLYGYFSTGTSPRVLLYGYFSTGDVSVMYLWHLGPAHGLQRCAMEQGTSAPYAPQQRGCGSRSGLIGAGLGGFKAPEPGSEPATRPMRGAPALAANLVAHPRPLPFCRALKFPSFLPPDQTTW